MNYEKIKTPKLTILTSFYNVESFMFSCVAMLKAQSETNFNVILVDDGSIDNSYENCIRAIDGDPRFCVIRHEKNKGLGKGRITGIQNCKTPYLTYIDPDDFLSSNAVENYLKDIETTDADYIVYDYFTSDGLQKKLITDDCSTVAELFDSKSKLISHVWHKVVRTDLYKKFDYSFLSQISFAEDLFNSINCFFYADKVKIVHKAYYTYTYNSGSLVNNRSEKNILENISVNKKLLANPIFKINESIKKYIEYDSFYAFGLLIFPELKNKFQRTPHFSLWRKIISDCPIYPPKQSSPLIKLYIWLIRNKIDFIACLFWQFLFIKNCVKKLNNNNCYSSCKYQFFEYSENQKIAGCKAPLDSRFFAEQFGFKPIYFFHWGERDIFHRITGQIRRCFEYFFAFLRIKKNSILFLQFPYVRGGVFGRRLFFRYARKLKKIKVITLIHDLNELRYENSEKEIKLFDFAVSCSDLLVAHNENMCDYLSAVRGISPQKIVSLGLFDYKASSPDSKISFEKSISIAGNLDSNKSAYLKVLPDLGLPVYLYGMNYNNKNSSKNIIYEGCFEPECITNKLCHGFGLVWDGISGGTCDGLYGKYLQFNNPHKLSMYLTAGLPVIVWKESALCGAVLRNGLGIAVSSLYEAVEKIRATTETEYLEMHENCLKISAKLRSGYFLRTALRKCLERLADSEAHSGYTKSDVAPSADSVLSADMLSADSVH